MFWQWNVLTYSFKTINQLHVTHCLPFLNRLTKTSNFRISQRIKMTNEWEKTSSVWDCFEKKKFEWNVRDVCTVNNCQSSFSIHTPTTTLRYHLKDNGYYLDETQAHFSKGAFCSTLEMQKEQQQQHFVDTFWEWIVDVCLQFCILENEKPRSLIWICNATLKVPYRVTVSYRGTVSRRIVEMCESTRITIRDNLKNIDDNLSLTADA